MSNKDKNKSLSERVTESLVQNINDSEDEETPKVTHFNKEDYEFQHDESRRSLSKIRKENVKLLFEQSSKYSGVIASRKSEDDASSEKNVDINLNADDSEPFEEYPTNSNVHSADKLGSDSDINRNEDKEIPESYLISAKNNELENKKGICVQNQLSVFEKLLEIRIHSQKMVNKANSLPPPECFNKLCSQEEFKDSAEEVTKNVEILLEKLIETQVTLAGQFSEIKNLGLTAGKRRNSRTLEDNDHSSKKFASVIEKNFKKFQPYRNKVLLKWEDRTKLLAPSTGTKRRLDDGFDIVRKIDNILMKRDEHVAKSQKLKGMYKLFCQRVNEVSDEKADEKEISSPYIYDDTDFYHSQLRELIEFKSNVSSTAHDVTSRFAELQKLRQTMKKKVDTRASKGRKMRFVLHNKLVNFMAPDDTTVWTDESKNELYRSLFVT